MSRYSLGRQVIFSLQHFIAPIVHTFHSILDHFIQPLINGIILVVLFRDLTPFVFSLTYYSTTINTIGNSKTIALIFSGGQAGKFSPRREQYNSTKTYSPPPGQMSFVTFHYQCF